MTLWSYYGILTNFTGNGNVPSKYCYLSAIASLVYEFKNLKCWANNFFVDLKSSNIDYFTCVNVHG